MAEATILDDLKALLVRCAAGDRSALPLLRAELDERPGVWRRLGDLAAHVETSWIGLIAGPNLVMAESLERRVEALKRELAGPAPSPLEGLLVDRVVATWLQVHQADIEAVGAVVTKPAASAQLLNRQSQADRRLARAIAALATVRRLLPTEIIP